jgi:hypothetical protein
MFIFQRKFTVVKKSADWNLSLRRARNSPIQSSYDVRSLLRQWHCQDDDNGAANCNSSGILLVQEAVNQAKVTAWNRAIFRRVRIVTKSVYYRILPKRMQLTCTAWLQSLNTHDDGRGKTYRSCQKHNSLSLHDLLSTGHHSLRIPFTTNVQPNLCPALTTQNTTEHNCIILHAQNTTALQLDLFLTGIHQSLVTNKEVSAFPSANHCQGQLQSLQSLYIPPQCPSVYPRASARLSLDRLPWNLILGTFTKICRENTNLFKIRQKYRPICIRPKYALLLPATLYRHKRAVFDWNDIRLLVRPIVCPSVRLSASIRAAPSGRIYVNLILGTSMKICHEIPNLVNIGHTCWELHTKT